MNVTSIDKSQDKLQIIPQLYLCCVYRGQSQPSSWWAALPCFVQSCHSALRHESLYACWCLYLVTLSNMSLEPSCSHHWQALTGCFCQQQDVDKMMLEHPPCSLSPFDLRTLQLVSPIITVQVIQPVKDSSCGPSRKAFFTCQYCCSVFWGDIFT